MNNQKSIDATCEYRGLPKIRKGTICRVEGELGVIIGGNSAANFTVDFTQSGKSVRCNCHPGYKFEVLNADGSTTYISDDLKDKKP